MRFLAYLVLFAALAIAGVGAYFSIFGLKLLFVGGGLSIVIMGTALEIGKLITATFLKQKWDEISLWMKTYLVLATLFLMGITSAGIYGYLSAGYATTSATVQGYERQIDSNTLKVKGIEQEISLLAQDTYNQKEIDAVDVNRKAYIDQHNQLITERNQQIEKTRNSATSTKDASADIVLAKQTLDVAKTALDSDTDKELEQIKLYNSRLEILDQEVKKWLDEGQGGIFRQNGLDKARETRELQKSERDDIDTKIKASQDKIEKLRAQYEARVKEYNDRVAVIEARSKSQQSDVDNTVAALEKENIDAEAAVVAYNKECDDKLVTLNTHKSELIAQDKNKISQDQSVIQILNSENDQIREKVVHTDVGTFKFIAKSLGVPLDKAVNYFIWMIMSVFDPLAVCLILAFNVMIKKPNVSLVSVVPTPSPTPTPGLPATHVTPRVAPHVTPHVASHISDTATVALVKPAQVESVPVPVPTITIHPSASPSKSLNTPPYR